MNKIEIAFYTQEAQTYEDMMSQGRNLIPTRYELKMIENYKEKNKKISLTQKNEHSNTP